jgi:hypothetical protein
MNINRHILKTTIIYSLLLLFLLPTACTHKPFPLVVVREKVLRFQAGSLPLQDEAKNALNKYLQSGGDLRKTGPVDFYLKNERFYTGLLDLLSVTGRAIKVTDLFSQEKGIYKIAYNGFKAPVVYDIIDATRETPAAEGSFGPLAVSDGHLWWIFFRDRDNTLTGLIVTVPYHQEIDHFGENR